MKLIDPNVIAREENSLYDQLRSEINPEILNKLSSEKIKLNFSDDNVYPSVELGVYKGKVAFRFIFKMQTNFRIVVDRSGNYCGFAESTEGSQIYESSDAGNSLWDATKLKNHEAQIIDSIAETIDKHQLAVLLQKECGLKVIGSIRFIDGNLVVHNNHIAYQLGFNTRVEQLLILDRLGNLLGFKKPTGSSSYATEIGAEAVSIEQSEEKTSELEHEEKVEAKIDSDWEFNFAEHLIDSERDEYNSSYATEIGAEAVNIEQSEEKTSELEHEEKVEPELLDVQEFELTEDLIDSELDKL